MAATIGYLSTAVDYVRALISESATFRTVVGAADATAALARIHRIVCVDPKAKRPFAIVETPTALTMAKVEGDFGSPIVPTSASVRVGFEFAIAGPDQAAGQEHAAWLAFSSKVEAIVQEMSEQAAGPAAWFEMVGATLVSGPGRARVEERAAARSGEYFQAYFEIQLLGAAA